MTATRSASDIMRAKCLLAHTEPQRGTKKSAAAARRHVTDPFLDVSSDGGKCENTAFVGITATHDSLAHLIFVASGSGTCNRTFIGIVYAFDKGLPQHSNRGAPWLQWQSLLTLISIPH
jgi:hypothetical protein